MRWVTNIVFLFDAVCYAAALALSTATEVKDTKAIAHRHFLQQIEALEPGTTQTMHENQTKIGGLSPYEEGGFEILARFVSDVQWFVVDIAILSQILRLS